MDGEESCVGALCLIQMQSFKKVHFLNSLPFSVIRVNEPSQMV